MPAADAIHSRLTSSLNRLVEVGFLEAQVSTEGQDAGEYGYTVTERGLIYYEMAGSDDPVGRLLGRIIETTLRTGPS
jgi:hypothetical protein